MSDSPSPSSRSLQDAVVQHFLDALQARKDMSPAAVAAIDQLLKADGSPNRTTILKGVSEALAAEEAEQSKHAKGAQ